MPLKAGTDRKTVEENFHDVRHGKTYARTKKKSGKRKANKQMIAIVLSKKRQGKKRNSSRR